IEIELIAFGGKDKPGAVEYRTPPGVQASPLFSRIAQAGPGKTIYFSGLYGSAGTGAEAQVGGGFRGLQSFVGKTRGDPRHLGHLVKATYYVSTEEASRKLNELRPKYYDPRRPPAASKAMVAGVGSEGMTVTLDMIAVPVPARNEGKP